MLEIKLEAESDSGQEKMLLTNSFLDNYNFVELYVNENATQPYTISVNDLYSAILAFKEQQKSYK